MTSTRSSSRSWTACALLVALVATTSCTPPAVTPREQARSIVLTIADGVRTLDVACNARALLSDDIVLAQACADAVDEARGELMIAQRGVDTWEAIGAGNVPCSVSHAADALSKVFSLVQRAGGGPMPPVVQDALRLAPILAGACRG